MMPNFRQHCAISEMKKKTHFAAFDFLVKIKLVPTVQAETPKP
jgi:hypothetical protein